MPQINKLGSFIVIGSAAIGGVVATMELGDRFSWFRSEPVPSEILVEETQDNSVAPSTTVAVTPAEPSESVPSEQPDPDPSPDLSSLEARLTQSLTDWLALQRCEEVEIRSVTADSRLTPASEASSGFDSVFIEGAVVLLANEQPHRLRLIGTGKGPGAESRAIEMAIENLSEQLAANGDLNTRCKKE